MIVMTLGEQIQRARKDRELTSLDLALLIGVTQATISRLENNEYAHAPKPVIARKLAEVLGITQRELLQAMGYEIDGEPTPPDPKSMKQQLHRMIDGAPLSDDFMAGLIHLIQAWTEDARRRSR